MKWTTLVLVVSSVACAGKDDELGAASCSIDGLGGIASATMDGDVWQADSGSWNPTGPGIQINLRFETVERSMTVRGNRDGQGVDISDRIADGDFPINVALSGEDGTGGVLDNRFNVSYASNDASGSLSILDVQGSTLSACFSFVAVSDDSVMMEVTEGMAQVEQLN